MKIILVKVSDIKQESLEKDLDKHGTPYFTLSESNWLKVKTIINKQNLVNESNEG